MLRLIVTFQILAMALVQRTSERLRRQDGQGSVEYLGVIIAAAVLVVGIIAAFKSGIIKDVTNGISDAIKSVINAK